jgi:hypothetical protein
MKKTLLWIAVLPGAILSCIVYHYINRFIFIWGIEEVLPFSFFIKFAFYCYVVLDAGIIPLCFCAVGSAIAPSYKKETGVFLIGVVFVSGLFFAIFFQTNRHFTEYLSYAAFLLGCIACINTIGESKKQESIDNESLGLF